MSARAIKNTKRIRLHIAKHRHKASIHVVLLMAMEEGCTRMICRELHLYFRACGYQYRVLHDAANIRVVWQTAQFEAMAMQMNGMIVHALVAELQAIAMPLRQFDLICMRIGFAVNHPAVHRAMPFELRR